MGAYVAEELSREGHNVYLIDKNAARIAQAQERMDVLAIEGEALDARVIAEAGIDAADMLLAVTDSDEQNIVIAGLAKEFGVDLVVARVRDDFYSLAAARRLLADRLRIDEVINPDEAAVAHMLALISVPGSIEVHRLAGGKAYLATFPIHADCPIRDKTLSGISGVAFEGTFPLAAAVYRAGAIKVPRGDTTIEKDDEVSFIMLKEQAVAFGRWLVPGAQPVETVIILGACNIGIKLAQVLEEQHISVTVIDSEIGRCVAASAALKKSTVLRGQLVEREILGDIDFATVDFLIAATEDEEDNLIAAFLAKEYGARHTIVVTQHAEYVSLLRQLKVDSVITPRLLAAGEILRFIRKGIVLSAAKVGEERPGGAEILEFLVSDSSPVANKKLREADLPRGTLVGLIIEGENTIIPHGDTILRPGARALVFTVKESLKTVQKAFAPK
jgi:trk system potassium uptake protein TrkA